MVHELALETDIFTKTLLFTCCHLRQESKILMAKSL